ncbi:hypothetical protein MRX96_027726 [Rhipicephalus microplus]
MPSVAWSFVFLCLLGASCQRDSGHHCSHNHWTCERHSCPDDSRTCARLPGSALCRASSGCCPFQEAPTEGALGGKDCLFLNVFTPTTRGKSLKPVVVYIHGGFFNYGGVSMKLYDASELSARQDLVVVTIAYRLGAFGFLNVGTEDAPGNMGLHDQVLALSWIKSNAEAFGGDPDLITLVGQSAGAFSVGIHLTSPKSRGLFKRAIMQSGSPFTTTMMNSKDDAAYGAGELARALNCPMPMMMMQGGGANAMLKCLRSKDVNSILNATASFTIQGLDGFFPMIGDEVIPVKPSVALRSGRLNARELLAGISEHEGDGLIHFMAKKFYDTKDADEVRKESMIFVARGAMITFLGVDSKRAMDRYFSGSQSQGGTNALHAAADLIGDSQLGCPTVGFAKRFVNPDTRVFMYKFSQQPSRINWPKVPRVTDKTSWPKFDQQQRYMNIEKQGNFPGKNLLYSTCDMWERVRPYE